MMFFNYFLIQITRNLEMNCKNQSNYNLNFLTEFIYKILKGLKSIVERCLLNPKENKYQILTIMSGKFKKND